MKVSKLLVAAAVAASAATAGAQTTQNCTGTGDKISSGCSVATSVQVTVPAVARMTFSTVATNLTNPGAVNFGTAGIVDAGPSIDVNANVGYTLTVAAAAANFTGPTGSAKPASSLGWALSAGASSFTPLDVAGTQVAKTTAPSASATYAMQYRTKYDWTVDVPGSYSLTLNYTLTAP